MNERVASLRATAVHSDRPSVGRVVGMEEGTALVEFTGSPGAVRARTVVDSDLDLAALGALEVLLVFEDGDTSKPVIVGVVRDRFFRARESELEIPGRGGSTLKSVLIDGERLFLEAKKEIRLRCGKSSIVLRDDGTVVVMGAKVVSRSSGMNKIKGATVNIN